MKNKHFLFLALAASLTALAACNKENVQPVNTELAPDNRPAVTVQLDVTSPIPLTRETVADTDNEAKVNTLDFFIFKADGPDNWVIDAYKHVTGLTKAEITMTQGTRRVCAVVNPTADYSGISSFAELTSQVTNLKDQGLDNFTMFGFTGVDVSSSTTAISVPVSRIVSRIKIHKITNAISNATLAGKTFQVTRLFLRGVPGEALFQNYPASYNRYALTGVGAGVSKTPGTIDGAAERIKINDLIYKALGTPPTVAHNASYTTAHSFYTFPIQVDSNFLSLIVEIKLGSQYYMYPVVLDFPIDRNRSYEISELKITRPGNPSDGDDELSDDETAPIEFVTVDNVNVSVQDWTLYLLGDDGIVEF